MDESDLITVSEYAPEMFKALRHKMISEKQLLNSFIPVKNTSGIFNFKTGSGKSPSFFFFPDNNLMMRKTLKTSEKDILFNGFLLSYFKYVMKNPKSLLMKIFGIYEM